MVLAELEMADRPVMSVFNKIDAVADPVAFVSCISQLYLESVVSTTVRTDEMESAASA